MPYQASNPINEAIRTYGAIDGIFRADREEAARNEDRQFNRGIQTQQMELQQQAGARAEADYDRKEAEFKRAEDITAELARFEREKTGIIGPSAARLMNPAVRNQQKSFLLEGRNRISKGDFDKNFFLQYFNEIYPDQINKGTGGSKRISNVGVDPQTNELMFGLDVTREDGTVAKKMMTKNRLTLAEGDTEVKRVPVQFVLNDMHQRMSLIKAFDDAGVGEGSTPEDNEARLEIAQKAHENTMILLRDPATLKRVEMRDKTRRVQAAINLLPTNATIQEKKQAIQIAGLEAGLEQSAITAFANTFDTPKDNRVTREVPKPGNMVQNEESMDGGKTWVPVGSSYSRYAPSKEGTGQKQDLTESQELLVKNLLDEKSKLQLEATKLAADIGKTVTKRDESGELITTTVTQADIEPYKARIAQIEQNLVEAGITKAPVDLPPVDEYVAEAQAFIKANPSLRNKVIKEMERNYPGSSKKLNATTGPDPAKPGALMSSHAPKSAIPTGPAVLSAL